MTTIAKPSYKTIRSIHYFNKHIVLDFGDHHVFELCHSCKHAGKHVKRLLQHFNPKLELGLITTNEWLALERRLFRKIWCGDYRSFVNVATYALGDFVEKRNNRIERKHNLVNSALQIAS